LSITAPAPAEALGATMKQQEGNMETRAQLGNKKEIKWTHASILTFIAAKQNWYISDTCV